ncbi:formin-like protein 2 [Panicum miliaceum]|uniref:Formin-like protein 2 n=1 Tax=Panicum miliaceum TaxID=4540 RepID=A0A3L6Q9D6_PANMI|nr:formin-like protein 2 [Panicum miliaceum]
MRAAGGARGGGGGAGEGDAAATPRGPRLLAGWREPTGGRAGGGTRQGREAGPAAAAARRRRRLASVEAGAAPPLGMGEVGASGEESRRGRDGSREGEDKVGTKEAGNVQAKFRVLRGLDTLGPGQKHRHAHGHGVSPAPTPARASLPLLHKDARLPVPGKVAHDHKRGNNATAPSQKSPPHGEGGDGERGSKKKSMQPVVVAAAAALSGAALVLLAVLVVFLTCRKFQGKRGGADLNAGTNKVSFEPAPGVFYLDAIKPYLDDADRDGAGKEVTEMAGLKTRSRSARRTAVEPAPTTAPIRSTPRAASTPGPAHAEK